MGIESETTSSGLTASTGRCLCGSGSCGCRGDVCSTMSRLTRLQELAYAVVDAWDSTSREDMDDKVDDLWRELIRRV